MSEEDVDTHEFHRSVRCGALEAVVGEGTRQMARSRSIRNPWVEFGVEGVDAIMTYRVSGSM